MVNDKVVSRFTGIPTREHRGIIQKTPLYPAEEVLGLLDERGTKAFTFWTRDCVLDAQNLTLDHDAVIDLLREAVCQGRFLNAQWCQQKPGGPWAACDSYTVTRKEWVDAAFKAFDFEYYIKFALNKSGKFLLLVSCHTSS